MFPISYSVLAAAGPLEASAAEASNTPGRRRLMDDSSIVRLHRKVIFLSGAESCFLNNLAI
jgi:hypothetical protein